MNRRFVIFAAGSVNSRRMWFFALFWICGLLLGALISMEANFSFFPVMRRAFSCRVSIVVLLLTSLLPFLITAYAALINKFAILYATAFCKAFVYALCGCVISRGFGTAGWLMQPLCQFTDTLMCAAFCGFCVRRCVGAGLSRRELLICVLIAAAVVIADYLLVSQLLASLAY